MLPCAFSGRKPLIIVDWAIHALCQIPPLQIVKCGMFSKWINYFSDLEIKYPDQGNLEKEEFVGVYGSKGIDPS